MSFTRGTTPTYTITFSGIPLGNIKDIYITFEQTKSNVEITKHGDDLVRTDENVQVTLSQRETLQFNRGDIKIQIRAIDFYEKALATAIVEDTVSDVLYEDVIS